MKPKTSNINERLKKRFRIVTVVFVIALMVIAARLFLIKVVDGEEYAQITNGRIKSSETILAKRGDILDRNNVLLATSTAQYRLIADPYGLLTTGEKYLDFTASVIEKSMGIPADQFIQKVEDNPNRRYLIIESEMPHSRVKDFIELEGAGKAALRDYMNLPVNYEGILKVVGVTLEESYKRNYAYGTFASSVLGFVRDDKGQYGLEKYYDADLAGFEGKKFTYTNNDNVIESIYRTEENGNTIQITLDYNIQAIVEKHMMDMLEESGAKTVAVTIQNPNTGEFLAMADSGIFDPNDPWDLSVRYSEEEVEYIESSDALQVEKLTENWRNFCVADSYEPGSTFKAFTVASAMEEGCISEDDYYNCDGSVPMLDYTIHCAEIDGHGLISLKDALAESCNIAMMDIAATEGVDIFSKYQSQFGFGSLTDIDLPNEMSCRSLIYTRENMTDLDLAVNSFGQSFNVTMVQMSSAFSALINGGTYYKPYIVKGIYNPSGEMIKTTGKTVVSRPVSEETSSFIKSALRKVVTSGTGTAANVPGYLVSGKTGTAQKGKRNDDLWVASFIGFAPYEEPALVCYVVIDEPASGGEGSSEYACELFSRIMGDVLPYINAVPEYMDKDPEGVGSPVPRDDEDDPEDEDDDDRDNEDGSEDEEDTEDDMEEEIQDDQYEEDGWYEDEDDYGDTYDEDWYDSDEEWY